MTAATARSSRLSPLALIARVGIEPGLSQEAQRQIAITNLFATTIALTTLPWTFVFTAFGRSELGAAVLLVSVLCGMSLLFSRRGLFVAARLWLLAWSNAAIFAFAIALGPASGIAMLFTATTCAPLALFDPKDHRASFLLGVLTPVGLGAAAQRFTRLHAPLFPVPERVLEVLFPGLLVTTVLLLLFIISYYYYVYERVRVAREREHRVEQARLDTALRESEQRYALAAEGANDGLWEWSAATNEVFYSERWKALLGFGPDEIGTSFVEWLDRVHPADRARVQGEIEAHTSGRSERLRSEHRMRMREGNYRWVLTRGLAIRDKSGRAVRMAGWMTDIQERMLATERLAESEDLSRQLVAQAADAMYFFDVEGNILEVNQRATAELGYARDELRGLTMAAIDAELTRERIAELMESIPADGAITLERVHRRKDGSLLPVELRLGLLRLRDALHVIASARDISVRKEMEAQLLLADRMASVGTLAAGVAHEVNNPLTSLLLNLEFIERQISSAPVAGSEREAHTQEAVRSRVMRAVGRAREGAERVGVIVRDLKTFSRGEAEVRDAVDLRRVIESTLNLAHPELKLRAQVHTALPADLPAVRANEARLGQVFLNLLLNALQSFSHDTPSVNRIVIRVEFDDSYVSAEVSDNGVGIPEPVLPRIFDPFFTTKPVGVGTGLGLYICRNIVQSFGGTLVCESEVGSGSTFRVRLPTVRSLAEGTSRYTPVGSARPTVPPPPDLAPARVLIIDDDRAVTQTLTDILSAHDVMVAQQPEDALRLLESRTFDLVLCDLSMHRRAPDRLKPQLSRGPCRWAFTTSGPQEEHELLYAMGAQVVEKPVRSETLWALLEGEHASLVRVH